MSDVAAYQVLFPVQGGMWTGYSLSTYLPALEATRAHTYTHTHTHTIMKYS